jgi:NAD(P)-dependent dehydrogenase (short-subunit alcohol dehydrogenase family)
MINEFIVTGGSYLVTGAASGIGKEVAKLLIESSNTVLAVDKDCEKLSHFSDEIDTSRLHIINGDITLSETRTQILAFKEKFDGVVNCAGIIKLVPFKFIREEMLIEIDRNNYEAPIILNSSLLKKNRINIGGSIVFISSVMSIISTETNAIYTGTKAALAAVTKTIALELAPLNIRVNCISPGFVNTPMLDYIKLQTDILSAEANHPLGFGEACDVANSVMFLLSKASRWITGTNLIIDGGYSAK